MFPSEHRIGGGVVAGRMRGQEAEPTTDGAGAEFTYRAAIAPLAMVPELWDRDFDFDLGYLLLAHERGSLHHGPSASLSWFFVRETLDLRAPCVEVEGGYLPGGCAPPGFHNLIRVALRTEADLRFTDTERDPGFGSRVGLRIDFSWFPERARPVAEIETRRGSRSGSTASGFVGIVWGEGGVALDLLLGGGAIGSQRWFEATFAVTIRIPAFAGVVIFIP
jgi:hypothetical protein